MTTYLILYSLISFYCACFNKKGDTNLKKTIHEKVILHEKEVRNAFIDMKDSYHYRISFSRENNDAIKQTKEKISGVIGQSDSSKKYFTYIEISLDKDSAEKSVINRNMLIELLYFYRDDFLSQIIGTVYNKIELDGLKLHLTIQKQKGSQFKENLLNDSAQKEKGRSPVIIIIFEGFINDAFLSFIQYIHSEDLFFTMFISVKDLSENLFSAKTLNELGCLKFDTIDFRMQSNSDETSVRYEIICTPNTNSIGFTYTYFTRRGICNLTEYCCDSFTVIFRNDLNHSPESGHIALCDSFFGFDSDKILLGFLTLTDMDEWDFVEPYDDSLRDFKDVDFLLNLHPDRYREIKNNSEMNRTGILKLIKIFHASETHKNEHYIDIYKIKTDKNGIYVDELDMILGDNDIWFNIEIFLHNLEKLLRTPFILINTCTKALIFNNLSIFQLLDLKKEYLFECKIRNYDINNCLIRLIFETKKALESEGMNISAFLIEDRCDLKLLNNKKNYKENYFVLDEIIFNKFEVIYPKEKITADLNNNILEGKLFEIVCENMFGNEEFIFFEFLRIHQENANSLICLREKLPIFLKSIYKDISELCLELKIGEVEIEKITENILKLYDSTRINILDSNLEQYILELDQKKNCFIKMITENSNLDENRIQEKLNELIDIIFENIEGFIAGLGQKSEPSFVLKIFYLDQSDLTKHVCDIIESL